MLAHGHLPRAQLIPLFDVFYAAQGAGTTIDSWQTWEKPRGVSFVYGLVQAAGGGGGRPNTGNVVGGGGGGSGSTNVFMVPAYYLPDTLYVRTGCGGAGGASTNVSGANGDPSYLCTQPNINNESLLVSVAGAGGGAAAQTPGVAGAVGVFSNQMTFGITSNLIGAGGAAGGAAGVAGGGALFGLATRAPFCGGSGGGGGNASNQLGGPMTVTGDAGVGPFRTIPGQAASLGTAAAGYGHNKRLDQFGPRALYGMGFAFTGGCGGGASNGGAGGNGGPGGYGCGGGGGGGGATTGNGGNGGDGLIILLAW